MRRGFKYGGEEKGEQNRYAKVELHLEIKESMRRNKNETKMSLFSNNKQRKTRKERKIKKIT